jgi:starch synthase
MRRAAIFLLASFLALPAAAQTRGIAPVEVSPVAPSYAGALPTALPTAVSALPGAPVLPVLPVPSISQGPEAAPEAASAAPAVAASPTAQAAAAPATEAYAEEVSLPHAVSERPAAPHAAPALPAVRAAASAPVSERGAPKNDAGRTLFDGSRPLNVMMAGSEAVPFVKTGGLADVVDAVSRGLAARGHRVMMVLPKYRILKTAGADFRPAGEVAVPIGGRIETAKLLKANVDGVDVVLIDHPGYYDREGGPYQGGESSYSEDDNDERFAFYSRASLEAAKTLGFRPDVVHAHDWQAALMPAFLKSAYAADPFFAATKTAVTIHNLAFQGVYGREVAHKLGFPKKWLEPAEALEYWGGISYLKAALTLSDAVTTVSPTYAREIRGEEFGMGMDGVLNARPDGVEGILNGLDMEMWNPATDPVAPRRYSAADVAEGKAANKAAVQRKLGLKADPDAPLFAVASRLAGQKGIDVIVEAIDELVARGAQILITGSGDKPLEDAVAAAVARHPGRVASHPFDEHFVRAVYAAADFLFMPSRFEPCGLSQLIAQRYGTIPLVTRTGGLVDTVTDLRDDAARGDGIAIRELSVLGLVEAVEAAIAGYRNPEALAAARATAMAKDSSWGPALDSYEALYRRLLGADSAKR